MYVQCRAGGHREVNSCRHGAGPSVTKGDLFTVTAAEENWSRSIVAINGSLDSHVGGWTDVRTLQCNIYCPGMNTLPPRSSLCHNPSVLFIDFHIRAARTFLCPKYGLQIAPWSLDMPVLSTCFAPTSVDRESHCARLGASRSRRKAAEILTSL